MAKYSWFLFLLIITFANGSFLPQQWPGVMTPDAATNFGTAANWDTD